MGIHSDCMYKTKDCTFDYARSGQEVNTPTVVLSLGDTRTLRWKRRHLFPKLHDSKVCRNNMVNIWHDDLSQDASFELKNNTFTGINPGDENPRLVKNDFMRSQYMHGGVSVAWNKLAYGMVYHKVVGLVMYDQSTHRMVLGSAETYTD